MKWTKPKDRIERKLFKQKKYYTYMHLNGFKVITDKEMVELLLQYIV